MTVLDLVDTGPVDTSPVDIDAYRRRLADDMAARGCWPEDSPWVRSAVDALPRHRFAPERVWVWDGEEYLPVDRAADPRGWAGAVYAGSYDSTVIQVTDGLPTSSLSCVSVVADMLDSLMPEPGHRVLELGTGAGWNAALLGLRAGAGRVVSVEFDAGLADAARERIRSAGAEVSVRVGDGSRGLRDGAPYDRVIATYAVEEVPWAWVAQTRPGGRIVTPWGRLGHVALTVAGDGRSASGWMQGLGMFMPSRYAAGPGPGFHAIRDAVPPETESPFSRDPSALADGNALFALRVLLPDVRITTESGGDGMRALLHDGRSSWATLSAPLAGTAGRPARAYPAVARQGGPRRLADEVARAWRRWESAGAPPLHDFGMTRTPDEQYIWSGDRETGPRWAPG
ncbi:methyltransferase domain-containing protein [Streptomyces sp. NPDC059255]|uniref:methyltransferase domain-containing protein n=1 Tax=Streptomyces sp. NPDC059255 TaxID=3346793 RepID=UPI00368E25D1